MNRLAFIFAGVMLTAPVLAAPGGAGGHGGPHRGPSIERLTEELGLDDWQVEEVRTILDEHRAEIAALKASASDVEREALRAVREETRLRLETVLTAEQLAIMDAKREQFRERMLERLRERRGSDGFGDTRFDGSSDAPFRMF